MLTELSDRSFILISNIVFITSSIFRPIMLKPRASTSSSFGERFTALTIWPNPIGRSRILTLVKELVSKPCWIVSVNDLVLNEAGHSLQLASSLGSGSSNKGGDGVLSPLPSTDPL